MTEEDNASAETTEDQEAQADLARAAVDQEQSDSDGTDWRAEYEKLRKESRKHERRARENADKAKQFDQAEEARKTEQQKLTERAEAAEKQVADYEMRLARAEVAAEKGLTSKQAGRLHGSTREELEADANELLAEFPASRPAQPDLKQGQRGSTEKTRQASREELARMTPAESENARKEGRLDDLLSGRS